MTKFRQFECKSSQINNVNDRTDSTDIANKFSNYFANTTAQLAEAIHADPAHIIWPEHAPNFDAMITTEEFTHRFITLLSPSES